MHLTGFKIQLTQIPIEIMHLDKFSVKNDTYSKIQEKNIRPLHKIKMLL